MVLFLVYGAIENALSKNILQNVNFFLLPIYLLHVKNIPEKEHTYYIGTYMVNRFSGVPNLCTLSSLSNNCEAKPLRIFFPK